MQMLMFHYGTYFNLQNIFIHSSITPAVLVRSPNNCRILGSPLVAPVILVNVQTKNKVSSFLPY